MKASEKQAKLKDLQDKAKDMQATYGYLNLQLKDIQKNLERLEILMDQGGKEFQALQQTEVEPEAGE